MKENSFLKTKMIELGEVQKGMYFECLVNDNSDYNISTIIRTPYLDMAYLELALKILIECQSALRMQVLEQGDNVYFNLVDRLDYQIEKCTLKSQDEIDEQLKKWTLEKYNLKQGPLFSLKCLNTSENETLLFVGIHHLIGDGNSLMLFLNQLLDYYDKIAKDKVLNTKKDEGYIGFLQQERTLLECGKYDKQRDYWLHKLKGAEIINIHRDFSAVNPKNSLSKNSVHRLDISLFKRMSQIAKSLEITPFMFALGVFSVFLGKTYGHSDVTFSTAFSHRPEFDQDDSIGCFIYNLPMRFNVEKNRNFKEIAIEARTALYEAYGNIGYPSNRIIREANLIDDKGRSPLDIAFIFDSYNLEAKDLVSFYKIPITTFPGTLMVLLEELNGEVAVNFQYKTTDFTEETIRLFAKRYIYLLEQLVENINQKLGDVQLMPPDEKAVIDSWHHSILPEYIPQTILEYFYKKVEQNPSDTSLCWDGGSWTNQMIETLSNQVANTLLQLQVKPEASIGVKIRRSKHLIVALIGIIKAGCVYVPIDETYSQERQSFIIKDADISIIIADQPFENDAVHVVDITDKVQVSHDISRPKCKLKPDQLAYIEYTSGTTGRPKGVMIEHQSVVNVILDLEKRFPLKAEDTYLLKTTFTFDIFGTEFYGWLVGKGKLFILENGAEKNSEHIAQTIDEQNITHINFVPSMFHLFLDYTLINSLCLPSLKWIFVGGEAIPPALVKKYLKSGIKANLENVYGPTETTMWATHYPIRNLIETENTPIGKPLNGYNIYILDDDMQECPIGLTGEIYIASPGTARGYLNLEDTTRQTFVKNPFYVEGISPIYDKRLYKTGDTGRWLSDGNIEYLGRVDSQVKLNGIRLELGEIESAIQDIDGVQNGAVIIHRTENGLSTLYAVYQSDDAVDMTTVKRALLTHLPHYMMPTLIKRVDGIPYLKNGKIDRRTIASYFSDSLSIQDDKSQSLEGETLKTLQLIWQDLLMVSSIDTAKSFFDNGGNSLKLLALQTRIQQRFNTKVRITDLMRTPTIEKMSQLIKSNTLFKDKIENKYLEKEDKQDAVAIIGMGVDLPGASDIHSFWENLVREKESIRHYSAKELIDFGISEKEVHQPNYIRSHGSIDDLDYFDDKFFGMTPVEVKLASPQMRTLYKTTWRALEDAAIKIEDDNNIGVYIGGSDDMRWYQSSIFKHSNFSDVYQSYTMATNHFLSTRLSYQFNLKGPSISSLSGCSTSLLTVHQASKAIQNGECQVAIAGGITIETPNHTGYHYVSGMMFSPDGHVRPFDKKAEGTVFSNGCGVVVLKSLSRALQDGDNIYAVIKGSAVNNDGKDKQSFTAPSIHGQVDVMVKAHRDAKVSPDTIGYVEAHGTGTFLGDPIEVESLTEAFDSQDKQFCILGSVKGNIGHTDTAAGVVGLIKTALILKNKFIPATINHDVANPNIDFKNTPFSINKKGQDWKCNHVLRRAAINSFGVGGTNVHMVLEESLNEASKSVEHVTFPFYTMLFSGKTVDATGQTAKKIMRYLHENNVDISDAAYTLTKRQAFDYRQALLLPQNFKSKDLEYWLDLISDTNVTKQVDSNCIAFLFSGQGTQYQGMTKDLYHNHSYDFCHVFRSEIDRVFACLNKADEQLYRNILFGTEEAMRINETVYSQLCIFAIEYAMAKVFIYLGVVPHVLMGHSIGELTAATLAEVWSLKDAVNIILKRSTLMQAQNKGEMIAITSSVKDIQPHLIKDTWICLKNTTDRIVIGGTFEAMHILKENLSRHEVRFATLKTSHAFHTPMMQEAAKQFALFLEDIPMQQPKIKILSNVKGGEVDPSLFCKADYWATHIIEPVQFEDALSTLLSQPVVSIEIGPGRTLSSFCNMHKNRQREQHRFVHTVRRPKDQVDDVEFFITQLGKIWSQGVQINWQLVMGHKANKKMTLPSYAFEKTPYPITIQPLQVNRDLDVNTSLPITPLKRVHLDDNQILEALIDSFKDVFGYDSIEPNEDFFELGGDSLKAASLTGVIESRIGAKVTVQDIFKETTPTKLSKIINIDKMLKGSPILPAPKDEDYPLSSSQERMFAFYQMDKEALAYNLPSATAIKGKLNHERVIKAFEALVQLHDVLRTQFIIKNGDVRQVHVKDFKLPVTFGKLEKGQIFDYQQAFDAFVKPFILESAPLFRAYILELNDFESIFFFDIHHIIADATAVEIISGNFNACYQGQVLTKGIQYVDYAVWEKQYMVSQQYLEQKSYWLNALTGDLPVINLPTDFERPKYFGFEGGRYHFDIPKHITDKINDYSKGQNSSNFMTLLGIWSAFLSRYTGDEDIIVGTPVAGRTRDEIQKTVGMFVNMLPIRTFPEAQKSVQDYLSEVKETVLGALSNQDFQFDQLVEALDVPRSLNRNAIFDVSFDYHNIQVQSLEVDNLIFTELDTAIKAASIDLLMTITEHGNEQLSGFIDYSSKLFKASTIQKIAEMYIGFIEALLTHLEQPIIDIKFTTAEDETFYIDQKKDNHFKYNPKVTLLDHFKCAVNKYAEQPAIITRADKPWSYRQLDRQSNSIAKALVDNGLVKGDSVGIYARRKPALIASMLGILKAGGHYVALDPVYPSDRIQYMIDNCHMTHLLIMQEEHYKFELKGNVIDVSKLEETDDSVGRTITPEDICYIGYTSGSTGYPKGVQVVHRGLVNMLEDHRERKIFIEDHHCILCIASPSFDIFSVESIIPLALGNRVYLADEDEMLDTVMLAKVIEKHGVTHIQATVSRLRAMVENATFQPMLKKLEVIISGGEHCPMSLLKYLQDNTQARVLNMYGPTETTVTATMADLTYAQKIDIGRPLYNVEVYIVNSKDYLQPIGVYGELCIGGHGLSKGYVNNEDMTNRVFKYLPEIPDRLVYKTGDLARINSDGSIDLIGRVDNQVKIRGYRVELGEIEKVCLKMPEIDNVVAKVFDSSNQKQTQLALFYIVTQAYKEDKDIEHKIKNELKQSLPNYMFPDIYERRQVFPLLPNKKVNRKQLLITADVQSKKESKLSSKDLKPLEKTILKIWKDVLSKEHISVTDNFFDIGGNSFNLMLVNNHLNDALDTEILLMTLFEFPTVRTLANHLAGAHQNTITLNAQQDDTIISDDIAVIGMSGKFPGANNVEQLWDNLIEGKESIVSFTNEELEQSGIAENIFNAPNYVNAKGYLADTEHFDYAFFNYSKKEASKMDPQIRLFHQCVYHAIEDAGYDTSRYNGKIALFGGSSSNLPWMVHQLQQSENEIETFELMTLNDKDFLTTKVSYKLNLKGMSANVQTACSTSLVAVHQAVRHLQSGESDMAIAGGVSITYPQKEGYSWYQGMIFSKDGHCRPFDKDATGTISGNGCGVVVLKRLQDAIRDGDQVYAVVKGSAVNNDGTHKIGFTAPSIMGQRDVIETALRRSKIKPEEITYVEAHGTGTILGDPIEIEGLKQAWHTHNKNYCAIGSIKSNIGHLDAAAGIAGFIKSVMILKHKKIPGLINFTEINPKIDIDNSPFYINRETVVFKEEKAKVAVSAFGMGGTNAHVILEEAPKI